MASKNTSPNYPFPTAPAAGSLHLRVGPPHSEGSLLADVAATIEELCDDGYQVAVATSGVPRYKVVDLVARGWHDPSFDVVAVSDLVGLTAALYRLWARGAARPALVIHDMVGVATGMSSSHDNDKMNRWLSAALAADSQALFELTGLSYNGYAGSEVSPLPDPAVPVVVASTTFRGKHNGLRAIKGSAAKLASTAVAVEADYSTMVDAGNGRSTVEASAKVLKGAGHQATHVRLVRFYRGAPRDARRCWTPQS